MPEFVSMGHSTHSGPLIRMHSHAETWEILFYTKGSGYVTIGRERVPFSPGKIVFMPQQVEHGETGNGIFGCMFLHFKGYSAPKGTIPAYDDDLNHSAETLGRMINREYHLKQPGWQRVTQELLDLLMLYFARWNRERHDDPMVSELKNVLVEHMHDPDFRVCDALDKMDVCSEHARRLFVRSTGKTPLQYLAALRIEEARQMLATGGLSVKEVAQRVGLPDAFYFSRLFRKTTGVAPREYAVQMQWKP
jgi:AraC-like DNA-binding protein